MALVINGTAQDTTTVYFSAADSVQLKKYEKSLFQLSKTLLTNRNKEERIAASEQINSTFWEALAIKNAFQYSFDSIVHISILYPADSSFRLFTWQLYVNANEYKYGGIIQKNTPEQAIFSLKDASATIFFPDDMEANHEKWFGALYYNIKQVETKSGTYYTLFGMDYNSVFVRRKIIDVLSFDDKGEPVFGAPIFSQLDKRTEQYLTRSRIVLDYSAEGAISCNYSDEYGMIIFDNLIPIGGANQGQGVIQVSDGSYRGYKFDGDKWVFVEKVFNDFQETAPREKPVLDGGKDGLFGPKRKRVRN